MGLIERVKKDAARITTSLNGFGVSILLTAPNAQIVVITGLHKKHYLGFDQEQGRAINTKTASITFSEIALKLLNPIYPVRNATGEIDLKNHKVTVSDSTGTPKIFIIREFMPDEVTGLIVCILGDYE